METGLIPTGHAGKGMSDEIPSCRICLEDGGDIISPCRCRGSAGALHRECLDTWRSTRQSRAFTHCEVCNFEYLIEEMPAAEAESDNCRRRRFHAYVARDTGLVFLGIQLIIVVLGLIVMAIDGERFIQTNMPSIISAHEKTTYYICGFVLFLAVLGLGGLCSLCRSDNQHRGRGGDPCHGCHGCYCYTPGGCDCNGGDGKECLVLLLVMVVVLAFIGIFVGIFLGSVVIQRILQRHYRVLWLKEEAKKFRVRDLHGAPPPEASAPSVDDVHVQVHVDASAPVMDHNDHAMASYPSYPKGLY